MTASGEAQDLGAIIDEEFIAEHYWGYTAHGPKTSEYQVEHPDGATGRRSRWKFEADVRALYGARFADAAGRQTRLGLHCRRFAREVHRKKLARAHARLSGSRHQLAQDKWQNSTVSIIIDFDRSIDS